MDLTHLSLSVMMQFRIISDIRLNGPQENKALRTPDETTPVVWCWPQEVAAAATTAGDLSVLRYPDGFIVSY